MISALKAEEASQMQLVEREEMDEDDDLFEAIDKLIAQGIKAGDVKKLQDAGIHTCNGLMMHTKKSLTGIKGLSEAKVDKICEAAEKIVNYGYMTGSDALLKRKQVVKITTGCQALDDLLGGVIETSAITEAFGEFRSGKTQLAHTLCVTTQLPTNMKEGNGKVAYIDTEGTFRPDRIVPIAERFGMDPGAVVDNIIYARAYTYEHQYNLLLGLAAKMSEEPFRILQKLAQMLSRLIKIAEEFNVAVYITNQVIADPGVGMFISDPKKPAVGHVLAHAATIRLSMPLLQGLARLLELLSNWFNVTLGGKLLEHLKIWLEPETLAQSEKSWKAGEEPNIAAAIIELFHLNIDLEAALPRGQVYSEINSPQTEVSQEDEEMQETQEESQEDTQDTQDEDYTPSQDDDTHDKDDERVDVEEEKDEDKEADMSPETKLIFFDLEWSKEQKEIIEFGAISVSLRTLKVTETKRFFIKPSKEVLQNFTTRKNGITRADLESASSFTAVSTEIFSILNDNVVAGHNIHNSDMLSLERHFSDHGLECPRVKAEIDTLDWMKTNFDPSSQLSLDILGHRLGLITKEGAHGTIPTQRHRPLEDCLLNLAVIKECLGIKGLTNIIGDCKRR